MSEREKAETILREHEAVEKRRLIEEREQKDKKEEAGSNVPPSGQIEFESVLSSFDALVDEIKSQQDTTTHTVTTTPQTTAASPSLPNRTDQSPPSLSPSSNSSGSPEPSAALRRPRKSSTTGRKTVRHSQPVIGLTPVTTSYETATLKALKGTGSVQNMIAQLQQHPSSTDSPTTKRSGSPKSPLASSRVSMFASLYDGTKKSEEEKTPQKSTGIPIRKIQSPFLSRGSSLDSSSSPSSARKISQTRKHSSDESKVIACPESTKTAHIECTVDTESRHDNPVVSCPESVNGNHVISCPESTENDSNHIISSSDSAQDVPFVAAPHIKQTSIESIDEKLVAKDDESDKTKEQDFEDSLTLAEALAMGEEIHQPSNDLKTNFTYTRITISPEEGQELASDSDLARPINKRRMSSKKRKHKSEKSTEHMSVEGELSDDSTELTRGLSPDTLYRVNYQLRHSASSGSNDSLVMSPTPMSPMQDRDRFVVESKPWYKKGLGLKLKLGLRRGSKETQREDVVRPMPSRIRKIGSPGSLESTPVSTPTSPQRQPTTRRSATLSTRRLRNAGMSASLFLVFMHSLLLQLVSRLIASSPQWLPSLLVVMCARNHLVVF